MSMPSLTLLLRCSSLLAVLLSVSAARELVAAGPALTLLWPDGAPGAVGTDENDKPGVRIYLPPKEKATGAAVVICPGGGYGILATDHEGHQIARWFNSQGVAGFVLQYRHAPKYRHPTPLADAQRAIRLVRAESEKFGISPRRIGIMGFSAGGHLASTAATHFDAGNTAANDPIERVSCRPDFAILCYPVISMTESFGHTGSKRNLLGDNPEAGLVESLSNEKQVTKDTPPTFLFHTGDDSGVPVENSLAFYAALRRAGVPAELHVYQVGPHGVGLAFADPELYGWKDRLAAWIRTNGWLAESSRLAVTGTVTLEGKPLRWGMIALVPEQPTLPLAWAMISNGKYSIPANRGPGQGVHSVEVFHLGSVEPRPTLEDVVKFEHPTAVTLRGESQVVDLSLSNK